MKFWLLNTDESEPEGKDADSRMKARSVIAVWGRGYGSEELLSKPEAGDTVFLFLDKVGIIAMASFDDSLPFPSNNIFHKQKEEEFSRKVIDLVRLTGKVISPAEVMAATGYKLPARGLALVEIHDQTAIGFILSRFPAVTPVVS
jgi:hypothetical protein